MIRAIIVAATILLVSMPVEASCVWVLWTQTESMRAGERRTVEWDFDRNVHDSRAGCESALDDTRDEAVEIHGRLGAKVARQLPVEHDFFIRLGERRVIIGRRNDPSGPDWSLVYNYACLPDTLDPRGPKR